MKTTTLTPVALACALLVSAETQASPIQVYGNLGEPVSAANLSGTNTDFGPNAIASNKIFAQGFTTGTEYLQVTSVTLGLFVDNTIPENRTVSIYADSAGQPSGSPLFTSSATAVVNKDIYTFNFGNAVLSAGTGYWIVPQFDVDSSWYQTDLFPTTPAAFNASGYTYLGTKRSNGDITGTWSGLSDSYSVSISAINPVPEPSSIALAGMGIVVAGLSYCRRMRRVTSTAATETT